MPFPKMYTSFKKFYSTPSKIFKVVMVRHGQSKWNKLNLFAGWYDTELSAKGVEEAIQAGKILKEHNFQFDIAFSSLLKRAYVSLFYILKELGQSDIVTKKSWRLNARHYGELTGQNKFQAVQKYGEDKIRVWRRSYDVAPPPMKPDHWYHYEIAHHKVYRYSDGDFDNLNESFKYEKGGPIDYPTPEEFPTTESLKQSMLRARPYLDSVIIPAVKSGKRVLLVSHGNCLLGIVKNLDNMTNEELLDFHIPTGIPFTYELDENMKKIPGRGLTYLGDEELVKERIEFVKNQLKR